MANRKLSLIIKIGTAALGAADGMPDATLLGTLVAELAALKKAGHQVILVSSGAVGTGRAMIKKNKPLTQCSVTAEKQILASLGQAKLVALYQDLLTPHKLLASQVLLTKQDFRTKNHHKHMADLFSALQKQSNILPIINENDCVTNEEMMQVKNFSDNDELAGLLASLVNADRLIILSHITGVYDRGPDEKGAKIISHIDFATKKNTPSYVTGKSETGRGGMTSKLAVAKKMAKLGIRTHIASATEPEVLTRLLNDESLGTTVQALRPKRNAVKRWLASEVNEAMATVTANACLADMITQQDQSFSLLPVGLVKMNGHFDKGDLIQVVDEKNKPLAIGVARYNDATLRSVLGKKKQPVFIHYDQLHRHD